MSAVWRKTACFLCLCYTALVVAETKGVVWKKVGESITIQCRSTSDQDSLEVKKGLNETQIFSTTKANPHIKTIIQSMAARVQTNGKFPNMDILIKNLSVDDTGPYWCLYSMFSGNNVETIKGTGSVLLVVTENKDAAVQSVQGCESPPPSVVVVAAVGVAVVMLIIVLGFVIRIILRRSKSSVKQSRVANNNNNDVYEDMRGTIRR